MAVIINNKTYRPLTEQVEYLTDIIKQATDVVKKVVAIQPNAPTEAQLADYEIGDTIAVGTAKPYEYYVKTKQGNTEIWLDIGEFPKAGTQGPVGPAGEDGFIPASIDEGAYDVDSVDNVSVKGLTWYQKIRETNTNGDTVDVTTKQTAPIVGLGLVNIHKSSTGKRYEIELESTIKSGEDSCSLILAGAGSENYGCNSIVSGEDNHIQSGDNNFVTGQFNSVQTSNNIVCGIGNEISESSEALVAGSYCDDTAADNIFILGNGTQGHPSNALEVTNDGIMTFNNDQLRINPAEDNALYHIPKWRKITMAPVTAEGTDALCQIANNVSANAKGLLIKVNTVGNTKRTTRFYLGDSIIAQVPVTGALYNNIAYFKVHFEDLDGIKVATNEVYTPDTNVPYTASTNSRGWFTLTTTNNYLSMRDSNYFGAKYTIEAWQLL